MSTTTAASLAVVTTAATIASVFNGTAILAGPGNGTALVGNATVNATALVLPQLTTPFEAPTQCTPVHNWTPATPMGTGGAVAFETLLLPVTDAAFSACQPPGWDKIEPRYRFTFSNAVCPSGYNYNQLSDLYSNQPNTATIQTTAYCCPSGFSYTMFYQQDAVGISGPNCVKTTPAAMAMPSSPSTTASGGSAAASGAGVSKSGASTSGAPAASSSKSDALSASLVARNISVPIITQMATMLYPPWNIIWEKDDASTLSPSPPQVSVQIPVSTWVPGTEIDPSLARTRTNPGALDKGLGEVIGIVIGVVVAIFVFVSILCAWCYMRSRRKRREEFEREEYQLQQQRLERIGEYQRSRSPTDDEPLPVYVKSKDKDNATATTMAVPPYKQRSSEDSAEQAATHTNTDRTHEDSDGQLLHETEMRETSKTTQNSTEIQSAGKQNEGKQRHG